MATIHIQGITTATPEQFLAALTDFGPTRGKIWSNSQPKFLQIHAQTATSAEVTEGSGIFGGVWERVVYDWSDPHSIKLKTIDGNFWSNASGWHYRLTTTTDGRTVINYAITREAKNTKGRVAMLAVGLLGKKVLTKDFERTLRAIEAHITAVQTV